MILPRLLGSCLVWILAQAPGGAQDGPRMTEYQLKALYLGALCDYVQWPENSGLGGKTRSFRIGVLGASPFQDHLHAAWAGKRIRNLDVRIQVSYRIQDLLDSHVVFICESESDRLSEILKTFRGRPILTIGDTPEFGVRGVMINLYMDQKQVRFEINREALVSDGIKVSAHVLKLARIVK